MKRAGYFFYGFLPIITALALQYAGTIFIAGLSIIFKIANTPVAERPLALIGLFNTWTSSSFTVLVMVFYSLAMICICVLWYYSRFEGEFGKSEFKKFNPQKVLGLILLVPAAQMVSAYICIGIEVLNPAAMEKYEQMLNDSGLSSDNLPLILFVYSVILAPICEELIFRAVTLRAFQRVLPFFWANLLQATLFGIFHMNIVQGIYAFAIGVLFGYICEIGGSIYCSILIHMLFNLWGTILPENIPFVNTVTFNILSVPITVILLYSGLTLFLKGSKKAMRAS